MYISNYIDTDNEQLFYAYICPNVLTNLAKGFDSGEPTYITYTYDENPKNLFPNIKITYDIQTQIIDADGAYLEDPMKSFLENGGAKLYLKGRYAYNSLESAYKVQITINGETKVYNNMADIDIDLDTSLKSMDLTDVVKITSATTLDEVVCPGTYTLTESDDYLTFYTDYPFEVVAQQLSLTVTKTSDGRVIQRIFNAYDFCEYIRINPNDYNNDNGWNNEWKAWAKIEYKVAGNCLAQEE